MEKFLLGPGGLELRAQKEGIRESLGLEATGKKAWGQASLRLRSGLSSGVSGKPVPWFPHLQQP